MKTLREAFPHICRIFLVVMLCNVAVLFTQQKSETRKQIIEHLSQVSEEFENLSFATRFVVIHITKAGAVISNAWSD